MRHPRGPSRAPAIERAEVSAYRIPTDAPESDGTFEWDSTTLILVELHAAGVVGLGYGYADLSAATLIRTTLVDHIVGRDSLDVRGGWAAMNRAVRNIGRPGIASMAISAVDAACWDLKAKLIGVSLLDLLGGVRDSVPVYGSGGFTSYSVERLQRQLGDWASQGIRWVKMKVGRDAASDRERVRAARQAIGSQAGLFVDANGGYTRKQALQQAAGFAADADVTWFEEPVSSDDLEGLRLLRDSAPPGVAVTAGEYGYDLFYFRHMVEAGAVDILQADATRCQGVSGFMDVDALCRAFAIPLSAHTAPTLHAAACCAAPSVVHVEYFHDHARIESMLFDGALSPVDGDLHPDRARPGLGIEFKRRDAEKFENRTF